MLPYKLRTKVNHDDIRGPLSEIVAEFLFTNSSLATKLRICEIATDYVNGSNSSGELR